ncbi:MAG: hypothetical protein ACFE9Q_04530 [Candidatus Hodarchaeota archaeon]
MNHSNSNKYKEAFQLANEIKNKGNLEGIIFAYRDGVLIYENVGDEFNSKNFTSMCATVLESAVGIGETIGNQKFKKVIAELEEKTILIFECNITTFFILILNRESNISYIMNKLEEIIEKVNKM